MHSAQLVAQIQSLQTQVHTLDSMLRGLNTAAQAGATETYERGVRERVFMALGLVPNHYYTLDDMEKAVRYIVDGAK
jgi:hypothetical protein